MSINLAVPKYIFRLHCLFLLNCHVLARAFIWLCHVCNCLLMDVVWYVFPLWPGLRWLLRGFGCTSFRFCFSRFFMVYHVKLQVSSLWWWNTKAQTRKTFLTIQSNRSGKGRANSQQQKVQQDVRMTWKSWIHMSKYFTVKVEFYYNFHPVFCTVPWLCRKHYMSSVIYSEDQDENTSGHSYQLCQK